MENKDKRKALAKQIRLAEKQRIRTYRKHKQTAETYHKKVVEAAKLAQQARNDHETLLKEYLTLFPEWP